MSAWIKAVHGAVSLFPFAGKIGRLRNLYPAGRRDWFVYISSAAALGIYIYLNFFFGTLTFYWSLGWTGLIATVCIILYAAVHSATNTGSATRPSWKNGVLTFALLVLYVGSFALYTYTYNMLFAQRSYRVCHGILEAQDTRKPLPFAQIQFRFRDNTYATAQADAAGHFFRAVPRDDFAGMVVTSAGATPQYCQFLTSSEFPDSVHPVLIPINLCKAPPTKTSP